MLQALAWLDQTLSGGLDEVERAVRDERGYVASSPGFDQQPTVIDAASEVLIKLFGHGGHHARSAIGVAELPRNAPVEIEFIFAHQAPAQDRPAPAPARLSGGREASLTAAGAVDRTRRAGPLLARRRRPMTGDKVLLVSFPKSGSNWVRYCVEHFSGRRTPGTTRAPCS